MRERRTIVSTAPTSWPWPSAISLACTARHVAWWPPRVSTGKPERIAEVNALQDIADCDRNLGMTLLMSGELDTGEELVVRARDSFQAMGLTDKVDGCEQLLSIASRQRG